MSALGPWLVVGGAALVVVCVVVTLVVLLRVVRRGRASFNGVRPARSALITATTEGVPDDDKVMPLLLAAAVEVARADAAVVSFVRAGDRRRSYSVDLEVGEARSVIDLLVASAGHEPNGITIPIERPGLTGALAVLWQEEAPEKAPIRELEDLVESAFPPGGPPTAPSLAAEAVDDRARVVRNADLSRTLDHALLLQKIVDLALRDCGADAAAARFRFVPEQEQVSEIRQFAENEQQWAEQVLASETHLPSLTRYAGGGEGLIATAIVVPLGSEGDVIGTLVAAWRRDLAQDADVKMAELEVLAEDARPALENASRFRRLQALAGRDPATGLFDRQHFFDLLADAVDTARRTAQPLVLLLVAAAEIEVEDDLQLASLEDTLVNVSARIAEGVRELGVTCRVGLGEFAAITTTTDAAKVQRLADTLVKELPARTTGMTTIRWSAGVVQLDEDESAEALWQRAHRPLRSASAHPASRTLGGATVRLSLGEEGSTTRKRPPPKGPTV